MSLLLIKSGHLYSPDYKGMKDILIIHEKVFSIGQDIDLTGFDMMNRDLKILDASKCIIIPGHIDQHVHLDGGGGEGGPQYRTPPTQFSEFVKAGITAVVGLLGTDGIGRSLKSLFMKARELEQEGISTWIYTGAYQYPSPTITGSILSDLLFVDKVIGLKISLSDHRASHPTLEEFIRVVSESRTGGILAGKAGVVHIHMGSEKQGLDYLFEIINKTDIPIGQFAPTHLAKNEESFKNDIAFGKMGGYVDLTTGSSAGPQSTKKIKASRAVKRLIEEGVPVNRVTMSSDGNGSIPRWNEHKELIGMSVSSLSSLHQEFRDLIQQEGLSIENAIRVTSTNIAEHLKFEHKGEIREGKDADLLVLDQDSLQIKDVVAKGKVLMVDEKVIKFGTFE